MRCLFIEFALAKFCKIEKEKGKRKEERKNAREREGKRAAPS